MSINLHRINTCIITVYYKSHWPLSHRRQCGDVRTTAVRHATTDAGLDPQQSVRAGERARTNAELRQNNIVMNSRSRGNRTRNNENARDVILCRYVTKRLTACAPEPGRPVFGRGLQQRATAARYYHRPPTRERRFHRIYIIFRSPAAVTVPADRRAGANVQVVPPLATAINMRAVVGHYALLCLVIRKIHFMRHPNLSICPRSRIRNSCAWATRKRNNRTPDPVACAPFRPANEWRRSAPRVRQSHDRPTRREIGGRPVCVSGMIK